MEEGSKANENSQIACLREMLQKWQPNSVDQQIAKDVVCSAISPTVSRRIRQESLATCDSDEEGSSSPDPPPDVPKGYLALYVGPELRRFIIPTSYLSLPVFRVLLEKAEEEFGFDHKGGLTIPCETETFKYLLQWMKNRDKAQNATETTASGAPSTTSTDEQQSDSLDQERVQHLSDIHESRV